MNSPIAKQSDTAQQQWNNNNNINQINSKGFLIKISQFRNEKQNNKWRKKNLFAKNSNRYTINLRGRVILCCPYCFRCYCSRIRCLNYPFSRFGRLVPTSIRHAGLWLRFRNSVSRSRKIGHSRLTDPMYLAENLFIGIFNVMRNSFAAARYSESVDWNHWKVPTPMHISTTTTTTKL